MHRLGQLGGGSLTDTAYAVSADGSIVVGESGQRPFRWSAQDGMQNLDASQNLVGSAYGVSADGSVVVGVILDGHRSRAFRWTASEGIQYLTPLGSGQSAAYGVSANGNTIVGEFQGRAFRWTARMGMQNLNQIYASLFADGSFLENAYGISHDGRYIVGKRSPSPLGRGGKGMRA
ncbi:MAG: hypothetical protein ACK4ME_03295 [Fimbriimonadales bacterium]